MGRRKKIILIPAGALGLTAAEETEIYMQVFKLTPEQARSHRKLRQYGRIFITENAMAECQYQVIIKQGPTLPHQRAMGAEIVQILVHRIDDKPDPYFWRDMQEIKNAVIGRKREALELYPSEDRRMKDFPFRVMWGILSDERVPLGWPDQGE